MKNLEVGFAICENKNVASASGDVEGNGKFVLPLHIHFFVSTLEI
jgi:hypothetical protein